MKTKFKLFVLGLILFTNAFGQVDEIGFYFKKVGYIQDISYSKSMMLANFQTEEGMKEFLVLLSNPESGKMMGSLWPGLKIELLGDHFEEKGYIVAKEVKVLPKPQKLSIKEGIIVDIVDDYAVIDGFKVKLKKGGKIYGEKSKQYKGKKFDSFRQLKLGDFADVKGEYDPYGFLVAQEVEVYPNIDSPEYLKLRNLEGDPDMRKFLEDWDNPALRPTYYGKKIDDERGVISNSPYIHAYITELGQKLIPPSLKGKINFRFVVFDNPQFNATATDYGLVSVYTGLFNNVENEAQLAAVIGHEITHVLYKHSTLTYNAAKKTEEDVNASRRAVDLTSNAVKIFSNWVDKPYSGIKYTNNYKVNANIDSLSKVFSKLVDSKQRLNYSVYNQKQESQCDRVGLYLMAKNGYDPIEAMKVWRNQLSDDNETNKEDNLNLALARTNTFANVYNRYQMVPTASDFGLFVLKNKITDKAVKNSSNTYYADGRLIYHPDNIKRTEDLNELVGYYYTPNNTQGPVKLNQEELIVALITAQRESKEAAEKKIKEFEAKNKAVYAKQKAYEAHYNRFLMEISKRKDFVFSYEELNIEKLLKVNEFIKPAKCVRTDLLKKLNEAHTEYTNSFNIFINNFKNNKLTAEDKTVQFAYYFCIAKNYNDLVAQIAARMQICDTSFLNSLEEVLDQDKLFDYIEPSEDAILEVAKDLRLKENKRKKKKS